ncbi:hypothetical protein FQZ97_759030 [compost metagenome]
MRLCGPQRQFDLGRAHRPAVAQGDPVGMQLRLRGDALHEDRLAPERGQQVVQPRVAGS